MVCLLLKYLTLATNISGGLSFECEVNNLIINTLAFLFMNPHLFLIPYFVHSVGTAAGYDTCQFNKALYAIHHDV